MNIFTQTRILRDFPFPIPRHDLLFCTNSQDYSAVLMVIKTIFVILIILSLIIEKFIKRMRKRIEKSGSKGMMHALEAALNELVLLGFISFMLEIFGPVKDIHDDYYCNSDACVLFRKTTYHPWIYYVWITVVS